jgi:hypothetical protein
MYVCMYAGVLIRASVNQLNGATHLISQFMNGAIICRMSLCGLKLLLYEV